MWLELLGTDEELSSPQNFCEERVQGRKQRWKYIQDETMSRESLISDVRSRRNAHADVAVAHLILGIVCSRKIVVRL